MLIRRLSIGSPRIARALGALPDPRVQSALELHLATAHGADKVATAAALLELGGSSAALNTIESGLLDRDPAVSDEALQAAPLAGPAIVATLLAAGVTHPHPPMRIGALKMALYISGVTSSPLSWDHRDEILGLAKGATPEARRAAFRALCQLLSIDPDAYPGPP